MRKLFSAVLLFLFLVGAYFFVRSWKATASWGVGTGNIAARADGSVHEASTPTAPSSRLRQISQNPQKYAGQRVTVSGRVRGNTKYASNRNMYRLTDGQYSLLIVDDKAPPKEYWPRTVSGTVKVVKPPLGKGYAYIVSVKGNPNINLNWQDVKSFFGEKYQAIKKEVS